MFFLCSFNPVALTNLTKMLQRIASLECQRPPSERRGTLSYQLPSREIIETVAVSSAGDIRSAINALQFACLGGEKQTKTQLGERRDTIIVFCGENFRSSTQLLYHRQDCAIEDISKCRKQFQYNHFENQSSCICNTKCLCSVVCWKHGKFCEKILSICCFQLFARKKFAGSLCRFSVHCKIKLYRHLCK